MTTITHATGRTYDAPQVLQITIEKQAADDYGLIDITATFVDASRHISGRVDTIVTSPADIGRAVLAAYDAGQYAAI
jgi:hypothetical protein